MTRQLPAGVIRDEDERLAAFAGQLGHDLKAPITAVLGFTELLEDIEAVRTDPSAAAYVARCTSAATRMLGMVDDMLAFARVGGTLERRRVSLDEVMAPIMTDVAGASDVSWSGPDVVADPVQFAALLRVLVDNAVTYAGDDALIRVMTTAVDTGVAVTVSDDGPGIPAASRNEVLQPLVRLRKDVPGAGLGLATAVRIAAAHGGTLRIDETPGGGTTVTVDLPDAAD